jgi:hypothetical protein
MVYSNSIYSPKLHVFLDEFLRDTSHQNHFRRFLRVEYANQGNDFKNIFKFQKSMSRAENKIKHTCITFRDMSI